MFSGIRRTSIRSFQSLPQPPSAVRRRLSRRRPLARRFLQQARFAVVRLQREAQGAEVDQQAVRADVVGAHRLVVEGTGIDAGHVEHRAVEHDVAGDVLDAADAQLAKQAGQVLDGEARVAAAFQVQISVQNAVYRSSLDPGRGFPGVGRAEQVERGVGGEQLHHRGRVHRRGRIMGNQRRRGVDRLDDDGDAGGRNLRRLQRFQHIGRQAVGQGGQAEQGAGKAGE